MKLTPTQVPATLHLHYVSMPRSVRITSTMQRVDGTWLRDALAVTRSGPSLCPQGHRKSCDQNLRADSEIFDEFRSFSVEAEVAPHLTPSPGHEHWNNKARNEIKQGQREHHDFNCLCVVLSRTTKTDVILTINSTPKQECLQN